MFKGTGGFLNPEKVIEEFGVKEGMKKFVKNNKIYIFPVAIVFVAGLGLFSVFPGPTIQWAPEKIEGEIFIGTAKVFNAQFVSKEDLENVQLWITPELKDFLTVIPDSFDKIEKDKIMRVEIIASIPLNASIGSYDGTIHLKELKQKGKNKVSKTFAKPLPVILEIKEPTAEEIAINEVSSPTLERIYEDEETGAVYVRDEVIIGFKEGTSEARIKEIVNGVNGVFLGSILDLDAYQIQIPNIIDPPSQLEQIIQELEAYPEVIIATYSWIDKIR